MAVIVHKLVKIEEQKQNVLRYRWYVECACGFQGRVGTEEAARSQFNAHLNYHGEDVHFVEPVSKDQKQTPAAGVAGIKTLGQAQGQVKQS